MRIHSNQVIISTAILLGCLQQQGNQTASANVTCVHVCGVCVNLGIQAHTKTEFFSRMLKATAGNVVLNKQIILEQNRVN